MAIEQALAVGIGAPVLTAVLSGISGKEALKKWWRFFGLSALATFATAAAVIYLMPSPAPVVAGAVQMSAPSVGKSVSDVTVQLGRYAGGINYPGQMQAIGGTTDGSLIYID